MATYRTRFMCTAIKWGDRSDFLAVYNKFAMTGIPDSFLVVLGRALSCAMDRNMQMILLHKAKELNIIRINFVLNELARNTNGYDLVWQELKSDWNFYYQG